MIANFLAKLTRRPTSPTALAAGNQGINPLRPINLEEHLKSDGDGAYLVLNSKQLLRATGADKHIPVLRELTGYPPKIFDEHVLNAIYNFAERVQLAPASEAHHHAHPGGLINHTMEVLELGLKKRQEHMLPAGVEPEDISARAPMWTYGVVAAILLHDVGKTLTDHTFTLIHSNDNRELWTPLGIPISETGAPRYLLEFKKDRDYAAHQMAGLTMLSILIPPASRAWIATDKELMSALSGVCIGDKTTSGLLGKIIQQSDMASASNSFSTPRPSGAAAQVAAAEEKPMLDKITDGLRAMILDNFVACSKNGAPAHYIEEDDVLWVVVPEILVRLREYSTSKILNKNNYVFDMLANAGIAINNKDGRAIHNVIIRGKELSGTRYEINLRCLKLIASRIFDATRPPATLEGEVFDANKDRANIETTEEEKPTAPAIKHVLNDNLAATKTSNESTSGSETKIVTKPPPKKKSSPPPSASDNNELQQVARAATASTGDNDDNTDKQKKRNDVPRVSIPQGPSGLVTLAKNITPAVIQFFTWLSANLAVKKLKSNCGGAAVHFVEGGQMLLVSPRIFQEYTKYVKPEAEAEEWKEYQKMLISTGMCRKTPERRHLHKFAITVPSAKSTTMHRQSVLTGMLIERQFVERIFSPIPHDNPALKRAGLISKTS